MALHGLAERAVQVEPYRTTSWARSRSASPPASTRSCCSASPSPTTATSPASTSTRLCPSAYRCGQVWGIAIEVAGVRFYHQGSANLIDEAVRERDVDVFLAGVAGRNFTEDYWRRILPRLDPKVVVPTHYDNFFRPLGADMEFVSGVQLSSLPSEIDSVSADARLAALPRADLVTNS